MAQAFENSNGSLSPQMLRCLNLLAEGRTVADIAGTMAMSEGDVSDLAETARLVLSARNRVHAVNIAIRRGLI